MNKKHFLNLSFFLLSVTALQARAGLFSLSNRQYPAGATDEQKQQIDQLFNQLESSINEKIPKADDANEYGTALANSQANSTSSLGADYATKFTKALVGVQLIAGTKLGDGQSFGRLIKGDDKLQETKGVGASSVVYAGIPMSLFTQSTRGLVRWRDVRVFVGFMSINKNFSDLSLKTRSMSVKLQYRLLPERGWGLVRWNGVDITSGILFSKVNLGFTKLLNESKTVDVTGAGQASGTVSGTGVISGEMNSLVVPIEASSSVRLLYALDFFGGLGVDLTRSNGKATTRMDNAAANFSSALGAASATPELNLAVDKKGSPVNFRSFFGTQLNLAVLAVEAHVSRSWITGTWGLGAGVKLFGSQALEPRPVGV